MNKDLFISMVSKIDQTFEDEFKAEYNSPELIWEKIICKLTAQSPVICTCHEDNIFFNGVDCKCERCGVEILGSKMYNGWYSAKYNQQPKNTVLLCKVEDYYIIGRFDGANWISDSNLEVENVTHWRPIF